MHLLKWWLAKEKIWAHKIKTTKDDEVYYDYAIRRIKPLDCPHCLAFWVGLVILHNPIYALAAGATACLLVRINNKFNV